MDGAQELVGVGALGLAAANFWTGPQRPALAGVVWDGKAPATAHTALLQLGGELLLAAVLVMVAGQSASLGAGMAAVVAALWVLWGMRHYAHGNVTQPAAPAAAAP